MQYGLFIKGIGVTLEHSLKFWRDEFTKALDADKVRDLELVTVIEPFNN